MRPLKDIVQDAGWGPRALVKEVCEREGPANVVRVVDDLVRAREGRYGEALRFLRFGDRLPDLAAAIAASELSSTLEELLRSGAFWDRRLAICELSTLPLPSRYERLALAAPQFEAAGDIITLSWILRSSPSGHRASSSGPSSRGFERAPIGSSAGRWSLG